MKIPHERLGHNSRAINRGHVHVLPAVSQAAEAAAGTIPRSSTDSHGAAALQLVITGVP